MNNEPDNVFKFDKNKDVELKIQGHTHRLFISKNPTSCGGKFGPYLYFEGEGSWVLPFEELKKVFELYKKELTDAF